MAQNRFWLRLITLCATTALGMALGLAVVSATVAWATGNDRTSSADDEVAKAAEPQTYYGVVTDSRCSAKHDMNSGLNPAECTQVCLSKGAKHVLVNGDKVYLLSGGESELAGLAGVRAKVKGSLRGNTIHVHSAAVAQ